MNNNDLRQSIAMALTEYRKGHHLSQEEMADFLSDHQISFSTYCRAERASGAVSMSKLIAILYALNIDMEEIHLSSAASVISRKANEDQTPYYRDFISRYFYSTKVPSDLDLQYRKLFFLFVLYLPLFPGPILQDMIYRIGGSVIGYETYFFEQIEYAITRVPDSSAKKYADKIASRILSLSSDDPISFDAELASSDECDLDSLNSDDYAAYIDLLNKRFSIREWFSFLRATEL